ncbi:MAG: AAA family ATPase [Steroidobacteraceae bacterium]
MSLVEQALKRAKQTGRPLPLAGSEPVAAEGSIPAGVVGVTGRPDEAAGASPAAGSSASSGETTSSLDALPTIEIDADALRRAGYLPPVEQEREIAEQFRHIKRPLLARAFGRGAEPVERGRVIMVTSALPGEGKTFCALNLARSLCLEKDSSVLLIDADTSRPQVTRTLGLQGRAGLVDALLDPHADIDRLVTLTSLPKLTVIPAGRPSETAAELLSSARMSDILARLTSKDWPNRVVLLDAPPLLVTNEAKTLVEAAGQVVLVVRGASTPQSAVLDAIGHLPETKFVGLVLNESETVSGVGYGYGYYGRMYEYGQDDEEQRGG